MGSILALSLESISDCGEPIVRLCALQKLQLVPQFGDNLDWRMAEIPTPSLRGCRFNGRLVTLDRLRRH